MKRAFCLLALLVGATAVPGTPFADTAPSANTDATALLANATRERERTPAPRIPRADFLLRTRASAVTLSPDSRKVAWLQLDGDIRSVWTQSTAAGSAPKRLLGQTDATALYWTHDSRWVLLETPRQLFAVATAGQSGSGIVAMLGGNSQRRLLMVDPTQAAAVLLLERDPARPGRAERWRLLRADMRGRTTLLFASTQQIVDVAFTTGGRLAWLSRVQGDTIAIDHIDAQGNLHAVARCTQLHRCNLLPVTDRAGDLLLETDLDGDLRRLASMNVLGAMRTLHVDPHGDADLDAVTLDPLDGQPLIASYRSVVATNYGLTATVQRKLAVIAARYPGRNLEISVGRGPGARWLIGEQASDLQGERWHLYAPDDNTFRDILSLPPQYARDGRPGHWLPESELARKLPFAWTASDGMRLHGFVWLPPGRNPATLPLIAMVHGGPWNHASPGEFGGGYSQFLANCGYIVFEPNFRGSTSYGRDYVLVAHGDFGNGRVQQDIVEGVRYLLDHGVGDANRVGIVGASFGGYATLLGVTFQPDLFKVGVAIVPPPDFAWDLRWVARSNEALNLSRYIPFQGWLRMLGMDLDDHTLMARLHAQSPLANAAKMRRPLLIFASGKDHRVALRGVLGYAAKLKLLHKNVSLFVDADAGHVNYTPLSSEAYLYLLAVMLHNHLGGAAPTPPDPALREYLHRNLRIAGSDLRKQ